MKVLSTLLLIVAASIDMSSAQEARTASASRRHDDPPAILELDIKGLDLLLLQADGYSWGQAVWGEAELVRTNGTIVRIADLTPERVAVGWGKFSRNVGPDGKPLSIGSTPMAHGIFAHADSRVLYRLDGAFKSFHAKVGINHTAQGNKEANVTFTAGAPRDVAFRDKALRSLAFAPRLLASSNIAALKRALLRDGKQDLVAELEKLLASQDEKADTAKRFQELDAFARRCYRERLEAPLLFVKRHPYMAGHIYDDYLTYRPGGGIYILENVAAPLHEHRIRPLIDPGTTPTLGEGVYRDPDVSHDASSVLFAHKNSKTGNTSIYEIRIDGTGLRRLSDPGCDCGDKTPPPGLVGSGQHDITPAYLPDGRIVFTSTRTGGQVMCFSSYIDTLHTMNGDGSDIRCISVNNQNEFDPAVMPDGRILYGRWEYVDKTALYMQSLWTVNPDGSNETALFGNNMAKPTALLDARPVPGSHLVVAALTPHNGQAVGAVAMIDPRAGKNNLDAITNFTPEYPTEMDQGLRKGPCDPWPLDENVVLVANNAPPFGPHGVIELIDRTGFRFVLHFESDISCYAPMPIQTRPKELALPSMIRPGQPGRFLVHDIYQGMEGVERGTVKWIRVLETTSRVSGIPAGGRWWNQAFLVSWQGSYDVKNYLGIVPVEDDGSAYFEAPPGKALYFQALDDDRRLVQSQRTFVQSVPGITRSCMGCHIADDNEAPINKSRRPLALARPASPLQPESWGSGFVDYARQVQPILDRHCVSCHGGNEDIAAGIDLSGGWTWAFNISYETLIKNSLTGFLNCNNGSVETSRILPPRTHGSGSAPLAKLLLNGHDDRISSMTISEKQLVLAWMDGNCNYYGDWDYSPHAVCKPILDTGRQLTEAMKAAGCTSCHEPIIGNDWINLQHPELSRILRAPLRDAEGNNGLAWCRDRKTPPPRYSLVGQRHQPPDVFHPYRHKPPDSNGDAVTAFATTEAPHYQTMLRILTEGRAAALATPRVDMPGADVVMGKCRELEPLAPPAPSQVYRSADGPGETGPKRTTADR